MSTVNNVQHAARVDELGLGIPVPEPGKDKDLGQREFFELMIAQIKNQDPLKPLDSTEFLSQLAQFSTVTGISDMEKSVSNLAASLQSGQALQASTMVGRDVLVPGSRSVLAEGGVVAGAADLPAATANLVVRIEDPAGNLVRRLDLGPQPAGKTRFEWDGLGSDGAAAPRGYYTVRAEALIGDDNQAISTLVRTRVESVTMRRDPPGVTLNLQGLGPMDVGQVDEIL